MANNTTLFRRLDEMQLEMDGMREEVAEVRGELAEVRRRLEAVEQPQNQLNQTPAQPDQPGKHIENLWNIYFRTCLLWIIFIDDLDPDDVGDDDISIIADVGSDDDDDDDQHQIPGHVNPPGNSFCHIIISCISNKFS